MSLLPQRKKSAEEIAKLRETLGIPGQAPVEDESPASAPVLAPVPEPVVLPSVVKTAPAVEPIPAPEPSPVIHLEPEPVTHLGDAPVHLTPPLPVAPTHGPRPVRSLKRSERMPVLPIGEAERPDVPEELSHLPASHQPKTVRSLRKSELLPITLADVHTPPADSNLPVHRHTDEELHEIRRQSVLAPQGPIIHPASITAHLVVVIPGYLFALAGAVCFYYYELSIGITSGCVAVALLVAGFIFLKKPLSRHHAAFIAVMSMFVIVFGALHYFPQLQHGT